MSRNPLMDDFLEAAAERAEQIRREKAEAAKPAEARKARAQSFAQAIDGLFSDLTPPDRDEGQADKSEHAAPAASVAHSDTDDDPESAALRAAGILLPKDN